MEKYGIRGKSLSLISNHLTDKQQVVNLYNAYSSQQTITCCVPQTSKLGPLLFSILINDLPKASKFETRLYADDAALVLSAADLNQLNKNVNNELIKVESWLNSIKLSLNYSKTKYLLIKSRYNRIKHNDFNVCDRGIKLE